MKHKFLKFFCFYHEIEISKKFNFPLKTQHLAHSPSPLTWFNLKKEISTQTFITLSPKKQFFTLKENVSYTFPKQFLALSLEKQIF